MGCGFQVAGNGPRNLNSVIASLLNKLYRTFPHFRIFTGVRKIRSNIGRTRGLITLGELCILCIQCPPVPFFFFFFPFFFY